MLDQAPKWHLHEWIIRAFFRRLTQPTAVGSDVGGGWDRDPNVFQTFWFRRSGWMSAIFGSGMRCRNERGDDQRRYEHDLRTRPTARHGYLSVRPVRR